MNIDGPFKIDVWSDYVCPFCYLQLPILDQLRQAYGQRMEVNWHAFELRPEPVSALDPNADFLRAMWSRAVLPLAEKRNVVMKMPTVQPRSRKVLEAAAFARSTGRFDAFHKRVYEAYFEQGHDIGHVPTLIELGGAAGLDADALQQALDGGLHAEEVSADQRLAASLGLRAVPVLLLRKPEQSLEQAKVFHGTLPFERVQQEVERLIR